MTNEQTRADFEHWFSYEGKNPRAVERDGDMYRLAQAHHGWWVWQAATAKANQQYAESETEVWLIQWGSGAELRKRIFMHNAIGDYRDMYKDATVHELVKRIPLPPTGTQGAEP